MGNRAWKPPYDIMLRVSQALYHGNHTITSLVSCMPHTMPKHHIQLALQELVRQGCASMLRKGVPGKGFIGWYVHKHHPIKTDDAIKRKKALDDDEILQVPKAFIMPLLQKGDALSEAWPMPVPPLPRIKGRVVRRLAI